MINHKRLIEFCRNAELMTRQSMQLYWLRDKYRIQSEILKHRYEWKKMKDPDSEETKKLAIASKLLAKFCKELEDAYAGKPVDWAK